MKVKSEIYVVIAAILWGIISIFKTMLSDVNLSEINIVLIRNFVATVVFGIYLLIKAPHLLKIKIKDLWCFFGTGVVSLLFFSWCYFSCMRLTSVAVSAVLLYTSPVFVTVLSVILFKEKINSRKIIALTLAVVGCSFVTEIIHTDFKSISFIGISLGLLSGLGYALYSIFGKFAIKKGYASETITFYTFVFAFIFAIPFCNFNELTTISLSKNFIFGSLGIGVLCCAVPYMLYTKGLSKMSGSKASILAIIEPVVACIVGILIFCEPMSIIKFLGIILVLISTVIL